MQLALTASFTNPVIDSTLTDTTLFAEGLDKETTYFWRVQGQNSAQSGLWSEIWSFDTEARQNSAPELSDQNFTINEHAEAGTVVGTIEASDPDGDELAFTITAGNESGAFALDEATGELSVADAGPLDYETTPEFALSVEVSDGALTSSGTITVALNDIEEEVLGTDAPGFATPKVYPNPASDKLTVKWKDFKSVSVRELSGKMVLTSSSKELDLGDLSPGMYLLVLKNRLGKQVQLRIIKE
jgi:hypothetical protein